MTMNVFRHDEVKPINATPKIWHGSCTCNYCGLDIATAKPAPGEADVFLYDFVTIHGPWAVGCRFHYLMYRGFLALGTGKGQEYKRNDQGVFIKTRG